MKSLPDSSARRLWEIGIDVSLGHLGHFIPTGTKGDCGLIVLGSVVGWDYRCLLSEVVLVFWT
jgi:hypothetical protein